MAIFKSVSILFLFLLISFSSAKSIDNDSNSDESSSNEVIPRSTNFKNNSENNGIQTEDGDGDGGDVKLSPKDQLLYFTLVAFRDISQHYVEHAANISEKLLGDEALKAADTAILKEFRKNITEFIDRYKKYEELDELFTLVDLYSNTTSHYFELRGQSVTPDTLTIEKKLKKYGSDDLDKEFETQFMAFVDRFYKEFDSFKSKLNNVELQKENAMLEWLDNFKPIADAEEKIKSFEAFFRFYDE